MTGSVAPDTLYPAPLTAAEFTVTGTLPVELRVTVWLAAAFTFTLPKARLAALNVRAGVAAVSCTVAVFDTLFALAVSVAVCEVLTWATFAVKAALVAPAATVTDAGTVTALSLLARVTVSPALGAAAFSVTVHASEPAPI